MPFQGLDKDGAAVTIQNPALGQAAKAASLPVTRAANDGALSTGRLLSAAASTNATSVKGSAGAVRQMSGYNASSGAKYLKLYDKATAPTVGTDTPRKTVYLPPLAPFVIDCDDYYATGIAYAITGAAADADTTALAAGDILCLNVDYN